MFSGSTYCWIIKDFNCQSTVFRLDCSNWGGHADCRARDCEGTVSKLIILNNCYLPLIDPGTRIEIYGTDANAKNGWTAEALNKRINREKHDINMFLISRDDEHDRAIWAGDIMICIGKGLDFTEVRHETIRKKTYISISESPFTTPKIIGKEISF